MNDDFFIGWAGRVPRGQGAFLAAVGAGFLALMLMLALVLARTMDDAGGGAHVGEGRTTIRGVIVSRPYALLVTAADGAHPRGRTVMLSVAGKEAFPVPADMAGHVVSATGWMLRRGDLELLQVTEPLAEPGAVGAAPALVALGTWRLTGEICDGQCYAGAMRPGAGLAHRACADFCLQQKVPPVFVTTGPVDGSIFLLMASDDGGKVGGWMDRYVGLRVRIDGAVERRGDLLVFRADPASVVVP